MQSENRTSSLMLGYSSVENDVTKIFTQSKYDASLKSFLNRNYCLWCQKKTVSGWIQGAMSAKVRLPLNTRLECMRGNYTDHTNNYTFVFAPFFPCDNIFKRFLTFLCVTVKLHNCITHPHSHSWEVWFLKTMSSRHSCP